MARLGSGQLDPMGVRVDPIHLILGWMGSPHFLGHFHKFIFPTGFEGMCALDVEEVGHCDYVQWSQAFQAHTWPSVCLELPEAFVDYLKEDGVHLCDDSKALPVRQHDDSWTTSEDEGEEEESGGSRLATTKRRKEQHPDLPRTTGTKQTQGDSTTKTVPQKQKEDDETRHNAKIQEFADRVDQAILSLGGSVLPRLNWSCPSDAGWVTTTGSLRCTNADEIFLLLKCSSRIAYDLGEWRRVCSDENPTKSPDGEGPKLHLILRKWKEVRQNMEFRVFVRNNEIVGICQRDPTLCHNYEKKDVERMEIMIDDFFQAHVRGSFSCPNFALDVYLGHRGKVYIVDFNTFGGTTQSLLFTWDELTNGTCEERMKVVETADLIQPSAKVCTGVPFDLVDTSDGSALADFLKRVQVEQAES